VQFTDELCEQIFDILPDICETKSEPERPKTLSRTVSSRQQRRDLIGLDSSSTNPEISKSDVKSMIAAIEIESM